MQQLTSVRLDLLPSCITFGYYNYYLLSQDHKIVIVCVVTFCVSLINYRPAQRVNVVSALGN